MNTYLGIDLGTTNIKAVLADVDGTILGVHREQIYYDWSDDGGCELPVPRFHEALIRCIGGVCGKAGSAADRIEAVGYASQANTFLLLDADQEPLTPIISWQDDRLSYTPACIDELWERQDYKEVTGLGLLGRRFAVAKVVAYQNTTLWPRVRYFSTISDFLVTTFTGELKGDGSTASLLGIYDIRSGDWWDDALSIVGIDRSQLAEVLHPGAFAASVSPRASKLTGLRSGIPVVVGGLDHYIAAIGAGVTTIAEMSESTGTVLACTYVGDGIEPMADACVGPTLDGAGRYLLTFDNAGGVLLERYRESVCPERSFPEMDDLAARAAPGAVSSIERIRADRTVDFADPMPTENADEKIGREIRAILEATAFRMRNLAMKAAGSSPPHIVSTGGGARSRIWARIKAAVAGSTFYVIETTEPAALGGAFLAARRSGGVDPSLRKLPESWVDIEAKIGADEELSATYASMIDGGIFDRVGSFN